MKTKTIIIIILLGLSLFVFITFPLWEASWWSYKLGCLVEDPYSTGMVTGSFSNNGTLEVYLDQTNPFYYETLKHEECHQWFYEKKLSSFCANPPGRMMEEFTCYSVQYYYHFNPPKDLNSSYN